VALSLRPDVLQRLVTELREGMTPVALAVLFCFVGASTLSVLTLLRALFQRQETLEAVQGLLRWYYGHVLHDVATGPMTRWHRSLRHVHGAEAPEQIAEDIERVETGLLAIASLVTRLADPWSPPRAELEAAQLFDADAVRRRLLLGVDGADGEPRVDLRAPPPVVVAARESTGRALTDLVVACLSPAEDGAASTSSVEVRWELAEDGAAPELHATVVPSRPLADAPRFGEALTDLHAQWFAHAATFRSPREVAHLELDLTAALEEAWSVAATSGNPALLATLVLWADLIVGVSTPSAACPVRLPSDDEVGARIEVSFRVRPDDPPQE